MPHRRGYYHAHLSRGYAQFEQSSQVNLKTGWQRLLEWLETRPMSGIDEGYEYETQGNSTSLCAEILFHFKRVHRMMSANYARFHAYMYIILQGRTRNLKSNFELGFIARLPSANAKQATGTLMRKCTGSSILPRHSPRCNGADTGKSGASSFLFLFTPFYSFKHMPFHFVCRYATLAEDGPEFEAVR
ncbi:hypothetical protein PCH_Pc22g20540 [Penicillium rubens Wisconsin 54-1255]|uniref:Uncharacterized protein n=1 Tax=Penicillium rubens (strain ATCC 28089 / DSM 1075 / NRRL 1951 / Wisconsin 54-1255) TaxID=500485 RepID=B6HR63_PENRW|nr:hypothetical protein PCH_Pc22g20540 [Penicillium rubens Wisconsin 54-1255]